MRESGARDRNGTEIGRAVLGTLVGGTIFLVVMLLLAGIAVALGWIARPGDGPLDLGPWLRLEIAGGAVASILAGAVARRVSGSARGPALLAVIAFCIGLLEAIEILRFAATGLALVPRTLVLVAPFVAAAGVLLGGWRPGPVAGRFRVATAMRYALPVSVLAAAAAIALFALPARPAGRETEIVAAALTLDVTVAVPALVFVLFVRTRRAPWLVLVPTFVVGYAIAFATLPREHHALLDAMRVLAIPAELTLVAYLAYLARKAFSEASREEGDFATRFRSAARKVLGARVPADILTTEVALLYHAFRGRTPSPAGAFSIHRATGYGAVLVGIGLALVTETIALHFLVGMWSRTAAWILTGLSVYAGIWLLGDFRAIVSRPILVGPERLSLRVGLRWEAEIPIERLAGIERIDGIDGIERIDGIEPVASAKTTARKDLLTAALLGKPNLRLVLREPTEVAGLYGLVRTVFEIRLRLDEPERFVFALSPSIGTAPCLSPSPAPLATRGATSPSDSSGPGAPRSGS
jgi:hypothetical protein